MTLIAGEMRENILRWFGNMLRGEITREIVEKMGEIKVKGNRGKVGDQKRGRWRLLGKI